MSMSTKFRNVTGRVASIRLPENVYVLLVKRAEKLGKSVSEYGRMVIERELVRTHHKRMR